MRGMKGVVANYDAAIANLLEARHQFAEDESRSWIDTRLSFESSEKTY